MTYYAELDANKQVIRVVVCDDPVWLQSRLGGTWVQIADADANKQYAGPGMYDSQTVAPRRFIAPWAQPQGAHDAIGKGEWRWHKGRAWRSLQDANVFEPGVASWREMLTEWPAYVQPTGAQDAYQIGEKITFDGKRYVSKIDANVWTPVAYAAGWALQP